MTGFCKVIHAIVFTIKSWRKKNYPLALCCSPALKSYSYSTMATQAGLVRSVRVEIIEFTRLRMLTLDIGLYYLICQTPTGHHKSFYKDMGGKEC